MHVDLLARIVSMHVGRAFLVAAALLLPYF